MNPKEFEKILKALANRRRLSIVKHLKNKKEATVLEVAHAINLSFRSTSKHLNILFTADIVEREQRGLQMFYRLTKIQKPVSRAIIHMV